MWGQPFYRSWWHITHDDHMHISTCYSHNDLFWSSKHVSNADLVWIRSTMYNAVSARLYCSECYFPDVQVDNQLPFSVYPQVIYPLPPPPTIASTSGNTGPHWYSDSGSYCIVPQRKASQLSKHLSMTVLSLSVCAEPKPFVEASIILKKPDQSNVLHFKWVWWCYVVISNIIMLCQLVLHSVSLLIVYCALKYCVLHCVTHVIFWSYVSHCVTLCHSCRYVHVLVQKISLNVDLGFILSLVDFFSLKDKDQLLEVHKTLLYL